jgi:predicted ATPase
VRQPNNILLNWRERGSDYVLGPHQLSDGTLRAMALIALLLQPEDRLPSAVLIDEPELGLHPTALDIVASLLRSRSVHSQIIVATQSAGLVSRFKPEDIVVVERCAEGTTFSRKNTVDLQEWLEDYTLGELWEKNVIGGRPHR